MFVASISNSKYPSLPGAITPGAILLLLSYTGFISEDSSAPVVISWLFINIDI